MIQSANEQQEAPQGRAVFSLRILDGGRRGQTISIPSTAGLVVGRSRRCDLRIMSTAVSRMHCRLQLSECGVLRVHDLNSLTGTFVNGRRVVGARTLNDDDVLRIGPLKVRVVVATTTELDWYSFEPLRQSSSWLYGPDSTARSYVLHERELSSHLADCWRPVLSQK